jgi:hypothetical protein
MLSGVPPFICQAHSGTREEARVSYTEILTFTVVQLNHGCDGHLAPLESPDSGAALPLAQARPWIVLS